MATIRDVDKDQYASELLDNISTDELTANTPQDEDEECRRTRRRGMPNALNAGRMSRPVLDISNPITSKELSQQLTPVSTPLSWGTSLKPPSCYHDYPRTQRLKGQWS